MSVMGKLLKSKREREAKTKSEQPPEPKSKEYKVEFVKQGNTIGSVDVGGHTNPDKTKHSISEHEPIQDAQDKQETPTVPLFAKYDEGQVLMLQIQQNTIDLAKKSIELQEQALSQAQKNTEMLEKLYDFFVEQSK